MRIPLIDSPHRAAVELSSPAHPAQHVVVVGELRAHARATFVEVLIIAPPQDVRRTNGREVARWATGSTLTVATLAPDWWRGRRFDALLPAVSTLDLDALGAIAPAFATARGARQ